jgi:hypothetical protein
MQSHLPPASQACPKRVAAQPVKGKRLNPEIPRLKTFYENRGSPEPKLINITQVHYITLLGLFLGYMILLNRIGTFSHVEMAVHRLSADSRF